MSETKKTLGDMISIACGDKFKEIDAANGNLLDFSRECHFAVQHITKNKFTLDTAKKDQTSLKNAIVNVAAVGLSLNPVNHYAYLVPRDGSICLDISYRGLIKLATDTGSIKWAKAVLVYTTDTFVYKGPAEKPQHDADVFSSDRGEVVGGYCIAKTSDEDFLIETMSLADIHEVRATSKAYASGSNCPWKTFFDEMAKKTLIKRSSKTWPQNSKTERLNGAIDILNQHEGLKKELIEYDSCSHSSEQKQQLHEYMQENDGLGIYCLSRSVGDNVYTSLYHSFERGTKGKNQALMDSLCEKGRLQFFEYVDEFNSFSDNSSPDDALALFEELTSDQLSLIAGDLNPQASVWIANLRPADIA